MLHLVHISKIIRNFAVEKVMMSENKRNLTEKEEYYKLITDEKSNHIGKMLTVLVLSVLDGQI